MGVSCQKPSSYSILPQDVVLQTGDVVFRRGGGLTSRIVLTADRSGQYSHVGIVVDSCGIPMIVHAVPGEHDSATDIDRVKMDTPERFFSCMHASTGLVCRPIDSCVARHAASIAMEVYRCGVAFDHEYDDADTTRMYCTELIEYAFSRAGHSLAENRRHVVHLPFLETKCIMPSDIFESAFLVPVITF